MLGTLRNGGLSGLKQHNFVIFINLYISTKLGDKVYILLFNSNCVTFMQKSARIVKISQESWGLLIMFTMHISDISCCKIVRNCCDIGAYIVGLRDSNVRLDPR